MDINFNEWNLSNCNRISGFGDMIDTNYVMTDTIFVAYFRSFVRRFDSLTRHGGERV